MKKFKNKNLNEDRKNRQKYAKAHLFALILMRVEKVSKASSLERIFFPDYFADNGANEKGSKNFSRIFDFEQYPVRSVLGTVRAKHPRADFWLHQPMWEVYFNELDENQINEYLLQLDTRIVKKLFRDISADGKEKKRFKQISFIVIINHLTTHPSWDSLNALILLAAEERLKELLSHLSDYVSAAFFVLAMLECEYGYKGSAKFLHSFMTNTFPKKVNDRGASNTYEISLDEFEYAIKSLKKYQNHLKATGIVRKYNSEIKLCKLSFNFFRLPKEVKRKVIAEMDSYNHESNNSKNNPFKPIEMQSDWF